MKTLFTTILLASAVVSAPVFADDAKEVLAGNAAELSSAEMQTTVGAAAIATAYASNSSTNVAAGFSTVINDQNAYSLATARASGSFRDATALADSANTSDNFAIIASGVGNYQTSTAIARARRN
jgi:hypothetical protein